MDKMNDNNIRQWLWDFFIFTLLTIAMMLMLSSCKTKYVTVPEYHTQYVVKGDTLWMRDSILIHDSASVEIVGDTVRTFKFLYKDRYKYIYRNKVDTTIVRDSVPYAVPVKETKVKEVGKGWFYIAIFFFLMTSFLVGWNVRTRKGT